MSFRTITGRNSLWAGALICIFAFVLDGCSIFGGYERLAAIKSFSGNRREIKRYMDQQERFFAALKDDLLGEKLIKGMPRRKIVSVYGEPFSSGAVKSGSGEVLIYRRPAEYFSSDKVYLYLNEYLLLDSWRFEAASG